jgi:hypothetical protein
MDVAADADVAVQRQRGCPATLAMRRIGEVSSQHLTAAS